MLSSHSIITKRRNSAIRNPAPGHKRHIAAENSFESRNALAPGHKRHLAAENSFKAWNVPIPQLVHLFDSV
jgi:hypothetical protein